MLLKVLFAIKCYDKVTRQNHQINIPYGLYDNFWNDGNHLDDDDDDDDCHKPMNQPIGRSGLCQFTDADNTCNRR